MKQKILFVLVMCLCWGLIPLSTYAASRSAKEFAAHIEDVKNLLMLPTAKGGEKIHVLDQLPTSFKEFMNAQTDEIEGFFRGKKVGEHVVGDGTPISHVSSFGNSEIKERLMEPYAKAAIGAYDALEPAQQEQVLEVLGRFHKHVEAQNAGMHTTFPFSRDTVCMFMCNGGVHHIKAALRKRKASNP